MLKNCSKSSPKAISHLCLFIILLVLQVISTEGVGAQQIDRSGGWGQIRSVRMSGGLRAFWNVVGNPAHRQRAWEQGFDPVGLLNTYADYPGKQQRHIGHHIKKNAFNNPWAMPDYFSEIVLQNIQNSASQPHLQKSRKCPLVLDIEFPFQEDIEKAWSNPETKKASGSQTLEEFQRVYLQQWAKWFWLPCAIGQKAAPNMQIGIYGAQPFRRDYWGIAGKNAQQIDGFISPRTWKRIFNALANLVTNRCTVTHGYNFMIVTPSCRGKNYLRG